MQNLNLRHYWHVVLERRWLVITAFISVVALCLLFLYNAPKIFAATARIQIDREPDNALMVQALSVRAVDQDYLQTMFKNLMSRSLINAVYQKLRLNEDPRYKNRPDPVRALAEDIEVVPVRLSRLMDITVEHTDPEKAEKIANAMAEEFIQRNLDQKQKRTLDMLFFLRTEAASVEKNVEEADRALQEYREQTKIVSLDAERNTIYLALGRAQESYAAARSEARRLETTVQELDKHIQEGKPMEAFPFISSDQQVKQLQIQLSVLENDLAGLLKKYKDKHPNVIAIRSRVQNAREALQAAGVQVAETLRSQALIAKSNEEAQLATYKDWEERQMQWNQAKMKYDNLMRKAETSKVLYNQVLGKMKEIEIVGKDKANNVRLVDLAARPMKHIKPRVVATLFLGVVGGLLIAVGLAFFVNYLDDSIKSQDDIETYLKLTFLGYVPNIKTNSVVERDLQAHLHPQSNAAEAFRTVRAALSLANKPDRLRLVAVTSTIPSEGKSLVASNLAIVSAQTGLKTLLVDADLRRPSVHKTFQLHSPVGLAAYLQETAASIEELVHTTEVPNLDVICCGATPQTPSELVGSKRMVHFLQEAGKRYDRIVLDCPPISAVSDPLVISALADGVIFVTKFNKIRREHARKTIQRVQDAGIHVFGVVLNDIDFEGRDSYYYSYYYYQNRYYSSHYKPGGSEKGGKASEKAGKSAT